MFIFHLEAFFKVYVYVGLQSYHVSVIILKTLAVPSFWGKAGLETMLCHYASSGCWV